jgi:hypothetical protein
MSVYDDFLLGTLQDPNTLNVYIPLIEQTTKNWSSFSEVLTDSTDSVPKYHIMFKNCNGDTILHYICKTSKLTGRNLPRSECTDSVVNLFNTLLSICCTTRGSSNCKNTQGVSLADLLTTGKQTKVKRILLDTLQLHLKFCHLNSNSCCTNCRT